MNPSAVNKQRGAALPLTLLLVAFNVTIVVTLLIYATTELNASRNAVNTDAARLMARNGIELAGALIAANSTNNAYVSYQNIITNLPGDTNARLETKIANTIAPDSDLNWQREVNNPTALHSGFATNNDPLSVDLNYDVNCTIGDTASGYILPRTNPVNSNWRNLHTNMFNMKWVNVYKGDPSQATNLIGRFAFWVDDESTKINLNYSGAEIYNLGQDMQLQENQAGGYLPSTRTNLAATNDVISYPFDGGSWPFYMDISGIAGVSRANINTILIKRGTPPIYTSGNLSSLKRVFSPFYSALEIRSADSSVITNISEQSQLIFTTTLQGREPELSYALGTPRFDMYRFNTFFIPNDSARLDITNNFVKSLTSNYPGFSQKYSLPQFASAIANFYNTPSSSNTFTYSPVGGESPYFVNKARPLINELDLKIKAKTDTAGLVDAVVLDVQAELIFLGTARQSAQNPTSQSLSVFDELGPVGSTDEANAGNYTLTINFSPELEVAGTKLPSITLNKTDSTRWFKAQTNVYYGSNVTTVRTDSQTMSNSLGILTNSITCPVAPPGQTVLVWTAPTNITASLSYTTNNTTDTYQQTVPATVPNGGTTTTNSISANSTYTFFHLTSQPRADMGVRNDPRLGIHSVTVTHAPNDPAAAQIVSGNFTNDNSVSSLYALNRTWRSASGVNTTQGPWSENYLDPASSPLSPDITPPLIVFEADRGLRLINDKRDFMDSRFFLQNAAEIGDIPITTFKAGNHLAWSTPRLWGDGRTNMGDNVSYPPDWAMLDCIHSVYISAQAHTNRVFTSSPNASSTGYDLEHLHHGRVNINGLKSHFQIPRGTSRRADTIIDSVLIGASTKDFYADKTGGNATNLSMSVRSMTETDAGRTNVINFIYNQALATNRIDKPFYSPFQFLATFAGNTNSLLTNTSFWMSYTNGSETTSDRRIETIVRSLFQKVTTRGWQFTVFSLGQALQVTASGQTNILGESYMQAVWERAPKHNTENGTIMNASPGGAPPMRMLYMRELR